MADETPATPVTVNQPGSPEYLAALAQAGVPSGPIQQADQTQIPASTQLTPPQQSDPYAGMHPAVKAELQQRAAQAQQQQQPPRMGGKPLLLDYIQSMIKGPQAASPLSRPESRGDMTLNFMGQFLANLAQGLAAAGHGPGANLRGAAGAIQAPYQRELQQYQLGQQQQAEQAQIQGEQAKAQLAQAQAEQMKNVVMTPYGPMSAALASKIWPAEIKKEGTIGAAQIGATSRENVAGKQIASKEALAGKSLSEKVAEFKSTDAYRKWKTQLDNDTKLKVAEMTAGKAPAQMLQTATYADGALGMMSDAEAAMQKLELKGTMGSLPANKVQDWIFGKGLVDPSLDADTRRDIGKLRAALGFTSTAAMRAHTGRTSQEIYEDFKKRLGPGQDWSALRGAMDETRTLLTHYRDAASNASIQRIRSGQMGNTPPAKQYSPNNPFVPK